MEYALGEGDWEEIGVVSDQHMGDPILPSLGVQFYLVPGSPQHENK